MKKALKITALVLVTLLLLLILTPFLFQGKIKNLIRGEIDNQLNASVYFKDVNLSFIRSFPDARITLEDFGIVGIDLFERDTLAQGETFALVVDLMSVIKGEDIELKGILLNKPKIKAIVLEDGSYNWDIFKYEEVIASDGTTTPPPLPDSLQSAFKINLRGYEINDGEILYYDETYPLVTTLKGFNHSGKGNFTDVQYNLETHTTAESLTVTYDGITYLENSVASAEANFNINAEKVLHIDLLDNLFTVNDMKMTVAGSVEMPGDDYVLDLTFDAPETNFKSLLSLVPGAYSKDFKDVKADGSLDFDGFVKGTYNETTYPGFGLTLKVPQASIQYPGLPTPVTGIKIDLDVLNPDGDLEKTKVDIRTFHADLGTNPVDIKGTFEGMERLVMNANIKARLNLEDLTTMFPIEGSELKGLFVIDAQAEGTYDESAGTFPQVAALMEMTNGYVRNSEYPAALTDLFFKANLTDANGLLKSAKFDMPDFRFKLDGDQIKGSAYVENFDDPFYKIAATGKLDLEKMLQIYPIEGMDLKGRLVVESFNTQGRYSDIEAERYTNLPTSGKVRIENLVYKSVDLPAAVTVDAAQAEFTPSKLSIASARGKLGSSDYVVSGYFTNYLAYALMENEPLKGELTLKSQRLNINEWMTTAAPVEDTRSNTMEVKSPTATKAATEEAPAAMSVIPVPGNLDVVFIADIGKVLYDKMDITNLKGKVTVANEALNMQQVNFDMLGGQIGLSGLYDTKNVRKPEYSFFLDVKQLGIKEAFNTFRWIQAYVPISKTITGMLNTQLGIQGFLHQDMTPVLENINGQGLFELLNGSVNNSPILKMIADKTKIKELQQMQLKDVLGQFTIKDGTLEVKPFDLKYKNMVMTVGGRQNLSGKIDFDILLDVPSGMVGQAAFSAISNLTGGVVQAAERIKINLVLGGTLLEPKLQGGEGGTGTEVKSQLTNAAEAKIQDATGVNVPLNKDSLKKEVQTAKTQAVDSVKQVVEQTKQALADSVKARTQALEEEAKKKAAEEAKKALGDDAAKTLEDLKKKFGVPKKKGGN